MLYTTTAKIRATNRPCQGGFERFLVKSGRRVDDDGVGDVVSVAEVLTYAGLGAALRTLRAVDATPVQLKAIRSLGIRYARGVEHLLVDPRIKPTIDVAERHVMGQATDEELKRAQVQAELLAMQAIRDNHRAPSAFAAWAAWKATLFVVVDVEGAATEALSNANGAPVGEVRARHEAMLLQMLRDLEDEEMAEFIDEDEELEV